MWFDDAVTTWLRRAGSGAFVCAIRAVLCVRTTFRSVSPVRLSVSHASAAGDQTAAQAPDRDDAKKLASAQRSRLNLRSLRGAFQTVIDETDALTRRGEARCDVLGEGLLRF